jgi:hypothetical protein
MRTLMNAQAIGANLIAGSRIDAGLLGMPILQSAPCARILLWKAGRLLSVT